MIEMMNTEFNKLINISYFILQFPHIQKIHLNYIIENIVSFGKLQKMAQTANIILQNNDKKRNIDRIEML